jgi:hypothetical protein
LNPVDKYTQDAAILSGHISSMGGDGKSFCDIVLAVSIKRLSSSLTSTACFSNIQFCINDDATPLGRYLSSFSTQTGYISFLMTARGWDFLITPSEE